MTEVKTYELQRGIHRYTNQAGILVIAKPGDRIPLTEGQAKAFADKVKLVGGSTTEMLSGAPAPESVAEPVEERPPEPEEVEQPDLAPQPEAETAVEAETPTEVEPESETEPEAEPEIESETEPEEPSG